MIGTSASKADRTKRIGSSSAGPKVPESVDLRQSAPNWLSLGTAPPPQLCAGHSGIEAVSLWESSGQHHAALDHFAVRRAT